MIYKKAKAWLGKIWVDKWSPLTIYGTLFAVLATLLFVRLGTLLPGYSTGEAQALAASSSLQGIFDKPLDAPFSLLVHALSYFSEYNLFMTRLAATLLGLLTLALFCWLVQRWYGMRTAILGTLLFGTSAWFLHTARLGTPDVLFFMLLALVACGVWLKRSNNPYVLLLCFALAGIAVYVPGLVWLVAFVAFWEWKQIDFLFKRHLWAVALGMLLFAALVAPLAWAIYRTPELAKQLAGLPAEGWPSVLGVLQNFAEMPLALFIRVPADPETWLGNLPVLDAFAAAMFVLGAYRYVKHSGLSRAKVFIPVLAAGWILASLGGAVSLSMIVPFLYIIVATGVSFMLDAWLKVFPYNPIAKGIGVGLICIAIIAACSFQLRHYFFAWPNNPQVRQTFSLQQSHTSGTIDE
jgi:4-amino-4-deoxy-L-arabinose transferase-like glycosyltransferase